jgi:hypothetical protein
MKGNTGFLLNFIFYPGVIVAGADADTVRMGLKKGGQNKECSNEPQTVFLGGSAKAMALCSK